MAAPDFAQITKLDQMNVGEQYTGFERQNFQDFRYGMIPCEIYHVITESSGTDYILPTGFNRVLGGFVQEEDTADALGIPVLPVGDGSSASIVGLDTSTNYLVVIFGDKNMLGIDA